MSTQNVPASSVWWRPLVAADRGRYINSSNSGPKGLKAHAMAGEGQKAADKQKRSRGPCGPHMAAYPLSLFQVGRYHSQDGPCGSHKSTPLGSLCSTPLSIPLWHSQGAPPGEKHQGRDLKHGLSSRGREQANRKQIKEREQREVESEIASV